MASLLGPGRVLAHHVVVHEGDSPEDREAPGATHDAPDHVLGGLLQPMADGVLEHLVPYHRTYEKQAFNNNIKDHLIHFISYWICQVTLVPTHCLQFDY